MRCKIASTKYVELMPIIVFSKRRIRSQCCGLCFATVEIMYKTNMIDANGAGVTKSPFVNFSVTESFGLAKV